MNGNEELDAIDAYLYIERKVDCLGLLKRINWIKRLVEELHKMDDELREMNEVLRHFDLADGGSQPLKFEGLESMSKVYKNISEARQYFDSLGDNKLRTEYMGKMERITSQIDSHISKLLDKALRSSGEAFILTKGLREIIKVAKPRDFMRKYIKERRKVFIRKATECKDVNIVGDLITQEVKLVEFVELCPDDLENLIDWYTEPYFRSIGIKFLKDIHLDESDGYIKKAVERYLCRSVQSSESTVHEL